jgi:hypothetical protein
VAYWFGGDYALQSGIFFLFTWNNSEEHVGKMSSDSLSPSFLQFPLNCEKLLKFQLHHTL